MEKDNKFKQFLENDENRKNAESKAVQLWMVMTGDKPIETANETWFTQTQVVHRTTLSHSKAKALFQLLEVFGFLIWRDYKKRVFELKFDNKKCIEVVRTEIISGIELVKNDIIRYNALLKSDGSITEEDKKTALTRLKNEIDDLLKI